MGWAVRRVETGWLPRWRAAAAVIALGLAAFLLRRLLAAVLGLCAGAAALAFLALPFARLYERKLSRSAAALAGLLSLAAILALLLGWTLPALVRELAGLSEALPRSVEALRGGLDVLSAAVGRWLPGVSLPALNLDRLSGLLADLAGAAMRLGTRLADGAGRLSMMAILAFFFLRDREALLLRLELLIPQSRRGMAVAMGNAVARELRLYLRSQLLIALSVAALAALLLSLLGVRSAAALGLLIGLFNMIPYFGPFIGGVPAVLIALPDGIRKAAMTLAALILVQQLDGLLISPRIMGSVTGLSPALVLVALFAAARLAGLWGMLLAIPALILFRTLFRVYVQRAENI